VPDQRASRRSKAILQIDGKPTCEELTRTDAETTSYSWSRGRLRGIMKTILLLVCSNIFMTIAWYGHLKYRKAPLFAVIVVSWLIAFAEYCFQVPANRIGYGEFTAFQLKIIQEVVTLCVFVIFAWFYLGEGIKWNHGVSFIFLVGAVVFAFWGKL
jgi:uncharacterized protein